MTAKYSGDTYRPNLYEYFVKRAIHLTNKNGFQSFIVPDRLGFNEQFTALRKVLLMEGKFDSLLYKAKFPGVTADTLVYVYSPGIDVNKNHKVEIGEFHGERVHIPQSKFFEFQDYQLLPITPLIQKLYFEMKIVKPLRSIVSSSVGFIAKPNLITKEKHSSDQMPVLRGRNVCRYSIENQVYFDFKKQNLAGGTQDKDKLGIQQKILMRKTGFPILTFSG